LADRSPGLWAIRGRFGNWFAVVVGAFVSHSAAAPRRIQAGATPFRPNRGPACSGAPYNGPIGTFVNVLCADQVDRAMLVS
jgi:hypothetical protein